MELTTDRAPVQIGSLIRRATLPNELTSKQRNLREPKGITFPVSEKKGFRLKQIYSTISFRWLCCVATKFSVNGTASLSACPTYPVAFTMSRADSNVLELRSQFK